LVKRNVSYLRHYGMDDIPARQINVTAKDIVLI